MDRHKFNRVFITGGTGSVGRVLISAFVSNGYRVTFQFVSNHERATEIANENGATPVQIDFFRDPVALPSGPFDVLINNAGINDAIGPVHEIPLSGWEQTLRINLTIPFLLSKTYLPGMVENRWGRIVNISSIYGLRTAESYVPYVASKHGLAGLTKTIAREYARFDITCNEICPGPIDSDMVKRIGEKRARAQGMSWEQYLDSINAGLPAGRMAQPSEVAEVALFLASPGASYVNGASITVDGAAIT